MLQKNCERCGKKFYGYQRQSSGSRTWLSRRFCSINCANKQLHVKEMVKYKCKNCAKVFYFYPSVKKVYCSNECKYSDFKKRYSREKNPSWKGDNAGYSAIHRRISSIYGKAYICENNPNHKSTKYEWANLNGDFSTDRYNWKMMCNSCHKFFDIHLRKTKAKRAPTTAVKIIETIP